MRTPRIPAISARERSSVPAPSRTPTIVQSARRIAERRAIELIEQGRPVTEYMRFGDRVRIEMLDDEGRSVFGAIDQQIVRADVASAR